VIADDEHFFSESLVVGCRDGLGAQRNPHRCGHADRRGSSDFEAANSIGDGLIVPAIQKFDGLRQPALVEQPYGAIFPFNGRNHGGIL